MKNIYLLIFIISFAFNSHSQTNLNKYKYAVVPLQYEFLKGRDTYRLNTLTRVLFKRAGFKTYFNEEQLPEDLFKDRCMALYPDVKKVGRGPFYKRVQIIIKDCTGNVIYESELGESKENNHQKAYNEALRGAFKSIERLNYKYQPELNEQSQTESVAIDEETKDMTPAVSEIKDSVEEKEKLKNNIKLLRAQSIIQGFELLNSENEMIMVILKTAAEDVFIVKDKNAIVYRKNGIWYYSENDGELKEKKELNIKF